MIKVETILHIDNTNDDKYINVENLEISSKKESYYGFIQIKQNNKIVFRTGIELVPEIWFISLQIIEEYLNDGEGYWHYPALYKLKSINNNQIQISYEDEEFIANKVELLISFLDSIKHFVDNIQSILCPPDGITPIEFNEGIERYKTKVKNLKLRL